MSDVLDQSSIDALLAAVETAQVEELSPPGAIFGRVKRDPDNTDIKSYDFKRPERVSKDQMRALQTLHESFARNFGAALSGFLRTIVEVRVAACEQMTYSEFTAGLPNPTSFNLVDAEGLEGLAAFLVKWPDHPYAENAFFWRGEAFFAQGDFARAAEQYESVISRATTGTKVPDAFLKLAQCQEKQGQADKAKATFERLAREYPRSDAAKRIPHSGSAVGPRDR